MSPSKNLTTTINLPLPSYFPLRSLSTYIYKFFGILENQQEFGWFLNLLFTPSHFKSSKGGYYGVASPSKRSLYFPNSLICQFDSILAYIYIYNKPQPSSFTHDLSWKLKSHQPICLSLFIALLLVLLGQGCEVTRSVIVCLSILSKFLYIGRTWTQYENINAKYMQPNNFLYNCLSNTKNEVMLLLSRYLL